MALNTSGITDPGYNRRRNIVAVIASGSIELTARRHDTSVGPKENRAEDRTQRAF